ncbi:hypothetical protein ALC56_14787 [Trachymyrmex septentrionalis]|uniref:Uncharacterized protein n=1 Tax=Trachymyrmex septentrionalis TaxID=34720 RepID=A0A195ERU3_9HYME|nr:hypothetical protein ALC56_14787 [Trachymyrmex septentrionalis]
MTTTTATMMTITMTTRCGRDELIFRDRARRGIILAADGRSLPWVRCRRREENRRRDESTSERETPYYVRITRRFCRNCPRSALILALARRLCISVIRPRLALILLILCLCRATEGIWRTLGQTVHKCTHVYARHTRIRIHTHTHTHTLRRT